MNSTKSKLLRTFTIYKNEFQTVLMYFIVSMGKYVCMLKYYTVSFPNM